MHCNKCKQIFSARKGTLFFGLHTPMDKIVQVLGLLASGMGVNAVCRETGVTGDSIRSWIILASRQVKALSTYMEQDMHLEQVQIDELWSFIRKKNENLTEADIAEGLLCDQVYNNQGDRWSFVAVLPDGSYIHSTHHSKRTLEEAKEFISDLKGPSDGSAPYFYSDCWFYEQDAYIDFVAQVMNYTRPNHALKILINPGAPIVPR